MPHKDRPIDDLDRALLHTLEQEARLSLSALAERIGLSKSAVQTRLRRLQDEGVILGFHARLNPQRLARSHVAFVQVKLHRTTAQALSEFNRAVAAITSVHQCHMTAADYDYLLQVRSADIGTFRQVLGEEISALPHVASTSTHVSMESVLER